MRYHWAVSGQPPGSGGQRPGTYLDSTGSSAASQATTMIGSALRENAPAEPRDDDSAEGGAHGGRGGVDALLAAFAAYQESQEQRDDITVIGLRLS